MNDEKEEIENFPILKYYTVYSLNDVDNLESKFSLYRHEENYESADTLIENYTKNNGITFKEIEGNEAFFDISNDYIQVPKRSQFEIIEQFYATAFHEIGHSTATRLGRYDKSNHVQFGNEEYSKEELVAELTSSMVLGALEIENKKVEENSTAYLYGWLNAIKKDINLIISAGSKAQKSSDFILSNKNIKEDIA